MTQRSSAKGKKRRKKPEKLEFVQDFIPIKDLRHGIIETTDGRYIKILEIEPINFMLRSDDEQFSIISTFASWLKISPMKLQFKSITRRADSDNGEIFIEGLRIGKYTVTEVEDEVSSGYKRPEPVEVELVADETLTVNVHNDKITIEEPPKTGDNSNMGLWFGLLGLSCLGMVGTVIYGRRRKREELEG